MAKNYENNSTPHERQESVLESLDESYRPWSPRPGHLDPVFEGIRMEQMQLADRVFGSLEEAEQYSQGVISRFERESLDKGLLPGAVRLTGTDIMIPRHAVDPFTGYETTYGVPIDQAGGDLALLAQQSGIDGQFMGIGRRLTRADPTQDPGDEGPIPCRVGFHYQVRVNGCLFLYSYTDLFATGDVLHHELEYVEDRRQRELNEIMERLLGIESREIANSIDDLQYLLESYGDYATSTLKKVANMIDAITQSDEFKTSPAKCDAIEDLLLHYIDITERYTLTSPDALKKTADGYVPIVMSDDEPFCHDDQLAGIVLAPRYIKRDGKLALSKTRSVPYLVAERDDEVYYLPLGRLTSFYQR